jgi:hypothetical protein
MCSSKKIKVSCFAKCKRKEKRREKETVYKHRMDKYSIIICLKINITILEATKMYID